MPFSFASPVSPPLPSLGCQISKLKQQLQRTKLSRSGKEKERGSPLQGDHAVRGALRVCVPPPPRACSPGRRLWHPVWAGPPASDRACHAPCPVATWLPVPWPHGCLGGLGSLSEAGRASCPCRWLSPNPRPPTTDAG